MANCDKQMSTTETVAISSVRPATGPDCGIMSRARAVVHGVIRRHGSVLALKVLVGKRNAAQRKLAIYNEAIYQLPHVKQVIIERANGSNGG